MELQMDIMKVSKVYESTPAKGTKYRYHRFAVNVFNYDGGFISTKSFTNYKDASIHRLEQIIIMKAQRNEDLNIPDFKQLINTELWQNHFRKHPKFYYL